ncbi:MAG: ATP-binding cassette domain-containing protein [Ruminococcaceae bacterium]|nr:ATP-binding cassette domain-containing protein [Oscillospiraceae bacterium]
MEIQISNIKKKYGKKSVLNGISFSTSEGKCIGILGGNGCGKSTLFSILAGISREDSGTFLCDGIDIIKNKKLRSEILGYVPQGTPLFEELNAYDNLLLWYEPEELEYELQEGILAMLGVNTFLKTQVCKMSGGMKKRLAIGCAVAHKPKILLLDEPSAALDLICKERISNYLKNFKSNGGIILLATHDVGELELCDEMYIMKNGVLSPYSYDGNVHRLVGNL